MLKPERYEKIVQMVNQRGSATVEELAAELNVSKATIRRDLLHLGEDRMLQRTHGGATKYDKTLTAEVPIYLRIHMQKEEKERVAAQAVRLIQEGATIYIGAGTTGRALAAQLGRFHDLTVVTNDIDVAKEVSCTDNALIVIGGQLKRSSSTLYGFFSELMLKEFRVETAFMVVDAVDVEKGFMDFGIDEVSLKRLVLSSARHCVMMCDITKFEKSALVTVCPLGAVQTIITNAETDPVKVECLRESGLDVILASSEDAEI